MKDIEKDTAQEKKSTDDDPIVEPKTESPGAEQHVAAASPGVFDRLRNMFRVATQQPASIRDGSKDRTRSLLLLIGGSVGAVLLFIGVFSTPPRPSLQETRNQAGPNLGKPPAVSAPVPGPRGSVTPLLSADVRSTDLARDQLSPSDISGTSRRSTDDSEDAIATPALTTRRSTRDRPTPPTPTEPAATSGSNPEDPLAAYRINNGAVTPTYQYGVPLPSDSGGRVPGTFSYGASGAVPQNGQRSGASLRSSIVYVRETRPASTPNPTVQGISSISPVDPGIPLPPGTRLIARLDAAATSALQTPLVASIEYNYERDGAVAVSAGSKVIGEVRHASTDGYVDVRFHTLQTPDGRDMSIDATATNLDLKPLKGTVSGKNTGKRILSRTLSGVGTIAAYVVGGGLSSAVMGETLLRDRVAGNIALAGEEQLRNAAYTQNITVTLPANIRFYVVLQKGTAGLPPMATSASDVPAPRAQPALPTVQELRELMDLRREINRMYQESNGVPGVPPQ